MIAMVHSIVLLLNFGAVVAYYICAPSVRGNYTELFRGYDLKQRIAYRNGHYVSRLLNRSFRKYF